MTTLEHYAEQLAQPDQVILIDHEKVSIGVLATFWENNSGGSYMLDSLDHDSLKRNGWRESEWGTSGRCWYLHTGSLDEAKREFWRITGIDPDYCTCDCCGKDFYWSTGDIDECFGINPTDTEGE